MTRLRWLLTCWVLLASLACGGLLSSVAAEDDAGPVLASDEEAAAALEKFQQEYKATGLSGDDKLMQRDFALRIINKLHHPEIVKAIGKVSKSSDEDLRLIAVIYLGDQTLLPHQAADYVTAAMNRHKKDVLMQMTGLQSLGTLKYLGATNDVRALLKHKHFVVRKAAIDAIGDIGDTRMLSDVLGVLGVKLDSDSGKEPDKKDGGKETTEEGSSWDGVEVHYDTGTSGDGDQKMAEKIGKEQLAKNKAAAGGGAGGNGGGGGSVGVGGSAGRGGTARSTEELIPAILRTLKKLTGEEFKNPAAIRSWLRERGDWRKAEEERLDKIEKEQKAAR
ncbi:MAG: HEAT repeat domain-containing protein [Planctomycetota bacterium]|nr:HEAT repeat domain-containing protein [Planctomycetota bacterium]